jgi:selenocysteine-specific elongation factor
MEILEKGSITDITEAKAGERRFIRQNVLANELGLLPAEMETVVTSAPDRIIRLSDGTLLSSNKLSRLREDIERIINKYHEANPLADGIPRQELYSRLRESWFTDDDKVIQALVRYLMEQDILEDRGKSIALHGFRIEYTPEQQALKDRIAGMYRDADLEMIRTDDIFAVDSKYANAGGRSIINSILGDLADEGVIRKVNPSYYISTPAWDKAVSVARSFDVPFTIAEYRDRLGTSRKYASELLPAMDREGITIFDGTSRTVVVKH